MSGLRFKSSFVSLGRVAVQPKVASSFAIASTTQTLKTANIFTSILGNANSKFIFASFDYRSIFDALSLPPRDLRYNDELPSSTAKFSPFEELSGIPSTRPEIISVSEFKPLFTGNNTGYTSAGEFLDAQVKLMNLRHEAVAKLVNDLKKDPQLAEQLDLVESNFLAHVQNVKSHVDFLASLQVYIERLSKLFDLRDTGTKIDAATLLGQYYSSIFSNITAAKSTLSIHTYHDLLSQHGFSKSNILGFSSTKIFLQTLYEARKVMRAGSDDLVGVDPSLALRDVDASTINRRAYKDPHVTLAKTSGFETFANVAERRIHESDSKLTGYLQELETGYRGIDSVFAGASSDEISYTLKLRTLAREASYSNSLADTATVSLLALYGYPVNATQGNQQLFDAVYGQLGSRITDDRSTSNANSLSSVASRIINNSAVLTYEVDYLENDQGSVFTPGAAFYVGSTMRPSNSGFSTENAVELTTRLSSVVDKYVDFVGKFNLLPKLNNTLVSQDAGVRLALDSSTMTDTLYGIYVESANGYLRDDVFGEPIVDLLAEAATHPQLRANLHAYFCCVTDVSGDGLANAQQEVANQGVDLRQESINRQVKAGDLVGRVGTTVDKLIKNCVTYYKQITGDTAASTKVENALKNYSNQGPLSRIVAYVRTLHEVHKRVIVDNKTRYSHLTDNMMVGLVVQSVLDTARRYAYMPIRKNLATQINTNFSLIAALSFKATPVQQTPAVKQVKSLGRVKPVTSPTVALSTSASRASSYYVSKSSLKQAVLARLTREDDLAVRTALAPLNAIRVVRDGLKDYVVYLQRPESVKIINDILVTVGDRKLVELLADRGQIQLLLDNVNNALERINPQGSQAEDLTIFDDSFITSKTADVIKAVFSNAKFDIAHGSNIRVISFGLPHGFTARLRNKFKITSFAEQAKSKIKQSDVVIADTYRVDVRYPDLIFKPLSNVFELSRFPVRNERTFDRVGVGTPLDKALDAVGTKDYSQLEGNGIVVDSEYKFMDPKDYKNMKRNHVLSYMLEMYFRLLTGIPLSERELYVEDPDTKDRPAPFVVQAVMSKFLEKNFKGPPPPPPPPPGQGISQVRADYRSYSAASTVAYERDFLAAFIGPIDPSADAERRRKAEVAKREAAEKAERDRKQAALAAAHAAAMSDLAKKKTVYLDPELTGKYLLSPKLFERVFFVNVDPDEFEIDRDETFKSDAGRASFTQLQQAGEIVVTSERIGNVSRDTYKLRDHKTEKQMIFEKYFIVIRSYSPLTSRLS